MNRQSKQRTLTVGRSITVQLVFSFTSLHSTASLPTYTQIIIYVLHWSVRVLLNTASHNGECYMVNSMKSHLQIDEQTFIV